MGRAAFDKWEWCFDKWELLLLITGDAALVCTDLVLGDLGRGRSVFVTGRLPSCARWPLLFLPQVFFSLHFHQPPHPMHTLMTRTTWNDQRHWPATRRWVARVIWEEFTPWKVMVLYCQLKIAVHIGTPFEQFSRHDASWCPSAVLLNNSRL